MSLKTNYKDDIISGSERMYKMKEYANGVVSLEDVTEYEQIGDNFGAKDINSTNEAINRINNLTEITLYSNQWTSSSGIYVQTVEVDGITSEDNPILVSVLADGASASTQKAYNKAFGIIASGTGTTYDGYVIFKTYKKPEISITVGLKGV